MFVPNIPEPSLIRAMQDFTSDDTWYSAKRYNASGDYFGDIIKVKRPPGVVVKQGQRGILGQTEEFENMFILQGFEIRDSDPEPEDVWPGRIWAVEY